MAGADDAPWLVPIRHQRKWFWIPRRAKKVAPTETKRPSLVPKVYRRRKWVLPRRRASATYHKVQALTADMATLTVQHVSAGLVPTYATATLTGDRFVNEAGAILNAVNASGVSRTITITAQSACNQNVLHNKTLILAAGQQGEIGTFDFHYVDSSGFVNITYSGITSLTVAVTAP